MQVSSSLAHVAPTLCYSVRTSALNHYTIMVKLKVVQSIDQLLINYTY